MGGGKWKGLDAEQVQNTNQPRTRPKHANGGRTRQKLGVGLCSCGRNGREAWKGERWKDGKMGAWESYMPPRSRRVELSLLFISSLILLY